jgi:hypothetical protein
MMTQVICSVIPPTTNRSHEISGRGWNRAAYLRNMKQESKRDLRLWARRPDMITLTGGLAALAVTVGLAGVIPHLTRHPYWLGLVLAASVLFGVFGGGLLWRGLFQPIPLVDVEEPWNAMYDRLRNETQRFIENVATSSFSPIQAKYAGSPSDWQECARQIAIPEVDDRPLHSWEGQLLNHKDDRIRLFFEFARACEGIAQGGEFRRLAVRTYDMFRRSRDTRLGFQYWMEQEEVEAGAESIVVLLAYMEIARACRVRSGRTPMHPGFWTLAEEWHASTLRLPRK